MTTATCPNCGCPVEGHPNNACVLAALIGVVRDRENLTEDELLALHRNACVDVMWDDIGPILDRLEEGFYSVPEGEQT